MPPKTKIQTKEVTEEILEPISPSPSDAGWTEYVLDMLEENEVWVDEKGIRYPRVCGLRRIMSKFFDSWSSSTKVENTIQNPNSPFHTYIVSHTIVLDKQYDGFPLSVTGTSSVGLHNMDTSFPYHEETAETRARGRAYTNLLGLNVVTKDEFNGKKDVVTLIPAQEQEGIENAKISITMQKFLEARCSKLGIKAIDFANIGTLQYSSLSEIPHGKYKEMSKELNTMEQAVVYNSAGNELNEPHKSSFNRLTKLRSKNND